MDPERAWRLLVAFLAAVFIIAIALAGLDYMTSR
jgi:hypothetical protein